MFSRNFPPLFFKKKKKFFWISYFSEYYIIELNFERDRMQLSQQEYNPTFMVENIYNNV